MLKLTIGLSPKVFLLLNKRNVDLTQEESRVINAINQHQILLSDKIIEYYKKNVSDGIIIDSLIDALGNQNGRIQFKTPREKYTDGVEELIELVSKCQQKILLAEKKDLLPYRDKKVNLVPPSKLGRGDYTALDKYIFPVTYHVGNSHKCENIKKWFEVLFKDEELIVIHDRYILNSHGLYSLKYNYLPMIDKNTKIKIYCTTNMDLNVCELRKNAQNTLFDNHSVEIYYCRNIAHDRYIELSTARISIGAGLDILGEDDTVKEGKECDITVYLTNKKLLEPEILEQLR